MNYIFVLIKINMGVVGIRGPYGVLEQDTGVGKDNLHGLWYREWMIRGSDDDKYYVLKRNFENLYLLTNVIPLKDREIMGALYFRIKRDWGIAGVLSFGISLHAIQLPLFSVFKRSWKLFPFLICFQTFRYGISYLISRYNSPMFYAYLNKYRDSIKSDMFKIRDITREWFDIDDSEYMNYTNEDVDDMFSRYKQDIPNYSPIPNEMYHSNSWLIEVNNYLKGIPHKLKEHPLYIKAKPKFKPYKMPTSKEVHDMLTKEEYKEPN